MLGEVRSRLAQFTAAGCGGGANSAAVNVPPASSHTAAAKAATLTWLDRTSQMWVASDFAALDQVTTGEMRTSTRSKSSTRRCPRTRTGCRSS